MISNPPSRLIPSIAVKSVLATLALLMVACDAGAIVFRGLGDFSSGANGISADGTTIVGIARSDGGTEAFRWTNGMVGLGDLPGGDFFSGANAISADGTVIVGIDYSQLSGEAFLWTPDYGIRRLRTCKTISYRDWR